MPVNCRRCGRKLTAWNNTSNVRTKAERAARTAVPHRGRGLCGGCYGWVTAHGCLNDYAPTNRKSGDLVATVTEMRARKITDDVIAERLGMKLDSLQQALRRAQQDGAKTVETLAPPVLCKNKLHPMTPDNLHTERYTGRDGSTSTTQRCKACRLKSYGYEAENARERRVTELAGMFADLRPGWTWRDRAQCLGDERDDYFPEDGCRSKNARAAKARCVGCPVIQECLVDGLSFGDTQGVRGGLVLPSEIMSVDVDALMATPFVQNKMIERLAA